MTTESEIGTDLITITPSSTELEQAEVMLSAKVSTIAFECLTIKVTDDTSAVTASEALTRVRTFLKRIEEQRKAHLQPLSDYVKSINLRFSTLKQPIERAEAHLLNEVRAYRDAINAAARKEQDRQNRLAEKRADRAEAKGVERPIPEVVAPIVLGAVKSVETDAGKVSFRVDWKAERIPGQEHLIPREYLIPDDSKANAVARTLKGAANIPGYHIYSVEVPITRMK